MKTSAIKNYIKITAMLVVLALIMPATAFSKGLYIVKQSGTKIYIDTTEYNKPLSVNEYFKIYEEEPLINQKTGKSLGVIPKIIVEGKIISVKESYAIGRLKEDIWVEGSDYKMEFFEEMLTDEESADFFAMAEEKRGDNQTTPLVFESKSVKGKIIDVDFIDADNNGSKEIIALFESGAIKIFKTDKGELKPIAETDIGNFRQPISLEVYDLDKKAPTYVLVTLYDKNSEKIETYVYTYLNQTLEKEDTLSFMVRSISTDDEKTFFAQSVLNFDDFRPGPIARLKLKDGKFELSQDTLNIPKLDSIYGFNFFDLDPDEAGMETIITRDNFRIRGQFSEKSQFIESYGGFGKTPNRLSWNDEIVKFFPSLFVITKGRKSYIMGVENINKRGILTEKFSSYKNANLHILNWRDFTFKEQNKIQLGGYVYNFRTGEYQGQKVVIVPVILPTKKSKIKIINYERII